MTPPPGTYQSARKKRTPTYLLAIAATCLAVIGAGAIALAVGWNAAAPAATKLDAVTQQRCDTIKNRHDEWALSNGTLQALAFSFEPTSAKAKLEQIKTTTSGYLNTLDGYSDPKAAALKVAVAEYNVDVGFVALETQLAGDVQQTTFAKATASAAPVDTAYRAYMDANCK